MTVLESYKRFELKLNSLANADNVDISPGEYVLIFNEQQTKWYESKFKGKSYRYMIDDVQVLVNRDTSLTISSVTPDYAEFNLPADYFDYIGGYSRCSKGDCTDRRVSLYQMMNPDKEIVLRDEFNKPSFEYKETPITISQDLLQVYKTDFSIDSVFLTYYRYPRAIDIVGYTKLDGTTSINIDPELMDEYVNEIIDWCVTDVQRTFENVGGYQLSVDRVNRDTNK